MGETTTADRDRTLTLLYEAGALVVRTAKEVVEFAGHNQGSSLDATFSASRRLKTAKNHASGKLMTVHVPNEPGYIEHLDAVVRTAGLPEDYLLQARIKRGNTTWDAVSDPQDESIVAVFERRTSPGYEGELQRYAPHGAVLILNAMIAQGLERSPF